MAEALVDRLKTALAQRYAIERELGQGGMATVFLARDLRHDRRVAVKVLKPELAAALGAERFVHEIKTTAQLQHPHILPLFDSGSADGFLYYVMPYVEGETLRDKLNRERQLGIEEAVKITAAVADGLDYAHRHGVIHRDIKPENILLHDGRPMVADFGIALAVSAAAGGRMTETGLSLGTPHYMSPEQATAEREISGRSDIYSLAVVLYEMLTGDPPHTGSSAQQIIMKIVTDEARPVAELRKTVPPNVAAAVAKAVEKLPADRFESAAQFAAALTNERFTRASAGPRAMVAGSDMAARRVSPLALAASGVLAVVGVSAALWTWSSRRADVPSPVVHLMLDVDAANADLTRFAVSPEGDVFAFATDEGIAVRDAGQREYRVLPGTRSGESPSFSPDGEWIAFHAGGRLQRIAVNGGAALALVAGDSVRGSRVHWGADGSIVFEAASGLHLIPAAGGPPRALPHSTGAQSPRLLPDGSGVLYVDIRDGSKLMFYDLARDTATTLLEESSEGQYVETGHIVYGHPAGGLFAIGFDRKRRSVSGAPIPVVNDLQAVATVTPFVVTRSGTLVYRAGVEPPSRLLLRAPNGRVDTLPLAPRNVGYVRFSPDGRSLAITVGSARGTNRHTAIYDIALGTLTQFTFEGGGHSPVWSPDGRQIAFTAEGEGADAEDLFVLSVDRSTTPRRVVRLPDDQHATAWPADTMLVFQLSTIRGGGGVRIANPTASDAAGSPYLSGPGIVADVAVSPNARFAVFTSSPSRTSEYQSQTSEVFVRRFPAAEAGGQWKVSLEGGQYPRWSPDGGTVLYGGVDGRTIHSAAVRLEPTFAVTSRAVVMTVPGLGAWDVDRTSGRIVAAQAVGSASVWMVVVVNWLDELRRAEGAR